MEETTEKEMEQNPQNPVDAEANAGENTSENTENKEVNTETTSDEQDIKDEMDEYRDKYIRLYSEFDNYKKRNAKERIELFKTAGQDILTALLPVLDDFDRTMKSTENAQDLEAIKEGIKLVYHKLNHILEQKGLKSFTAVNTEFNPDIHEAITNIPAPSEDMKGKVLDEVEKGYMLNDKVIRFAKVVVAE